MSMQHEVTLDDIASAIRSVSGPEAQRRDAAHPSGVVVPSPITPGHSWVFATAEEGIAYLRLAWELDKKETD